MGERREREREKKNQSHQVAKGKEKSFSLQCKPSSPSTALPEGRGGIAASSSVNRARTGTVTIGIGPKSSEQLLLPKSVPKAFLPPPDFYVGNQEGQNSESSLFCDPDNKTGI